MHVCRVSKCGTREDYKCRKVVIAPSMHHVQFSTCVHVSRFVSGYISDESWHCLIIDVLMKKLFIEIDVSTFVYQTGFFSWKYIIESTIIVYKIPFFNSSERKKCLIFKIKRMKYRFLFYFEFSYIFLRADDKNYFNLFKLASNIFLRGWKRKRAINNKQSKTSNFIKMKISIKLRGDHSSLSYETRV